jgi:hypothetical protein
MNQPSPRDPLADYRRSARTQLLHYLILAMGLVFASMIVVIDPARHCLEAPCPLWLRGLGSGLGLLFALGAASALWRNFEWGSRIEDSALVWWIGAHPAQERRFETADIAAIAIETSSDSERLRLFDRDRHPIPIPDECVQPPFADWADAMARRFPHIAVERR